MARRKRTSPTIANAKTRASSLESIDTALDLGNDMTLAAYTAKIAATEKKLTDYNTALSALDGQLNDLEQAEDALAELSARMLAGVGVKYGKNSSQYEQAGGKRTEERATARRAEPQATKAA